MSLFNKINYRLQYHSSRSPWKKRALYLVYTQPDDFGWAGSHLVIKKMGIQLAENQGLWLLESYHQAMPLIQYATQFVYIPERDSIRLEIASLLFEIQTAEDLFILKEIYIEYCYNFALTNKEVVVIDIGMNVGMASLFFASRPDVTAVYGFEPFAPTYEQAQHNFKNNAKYAAKVKPHLFGLSSKNEHLTMPYNYLSKGRVGVYETISEKDRQQITIELRAIHEILPTIIQQHPQAALVLKIDCEGAEYELLETLHQQGFPDSVKAILMEWHQKGPDPLIRILQAHGFSSLSLHPQNPIAGMLYAFKS